MLFCIFSCRKNTCLCSFWLIAIKGEWHPGHSIFLLLYFTCSRKTTTSKNMHPLPQKMSLHVGVATSDVVDTNLAPAGSRLPRTRSYAFWGKNSSHFWAKRSWAMAKLFNDFGNMLESRQTINWNLKINHIESETRTCVHARYLQKHVWQCNQNMCGRALLAKTFWKCNQNRCGCALLAKTIDESPRLPWSSQSFRVLGLTWNGGKWLADIASNFPVWKAC